MYTLLGHRASLELTYDILLFLINRIEVMNPELMALETEGTVQLLDSFLDS